MVYARPNNSFLLHFKLISFSNEWVYIPYAIFFKLLYLNDKKKKKILNTEHDLRWKILIFCGEITIERNFLFAKLTCSTY